MSADLCVLDHNKVKGRKSLTFCTREEKAFGSKKCYCARFCFSVFRNDSTEQCGKSQPVSVTGFSTLCTSCLLLMSYVSFSLPPPTLSVMLH